MSGFLNRARFTRDHRWAPDHMSAFLDGELALNGRRRMERHVDECAECRALLSGLRLVLDALHRVPAAGGGADARALAASVRLRLSQPRSSG